MRGQITSDQGGDMSRFSRLSVIVFSAFLIAIAAEAKETEKKFDAIPGEYVVGLTKEAKTFNVFEILKMLNVSNVEIVNEREGVYLVVRSIAEKSGAAIEDMMKSGILRYAEPNYLYYADSFAQVPDDPDLPVLWGMKNSGQLDSQGRPGIEQMDSGASDAWQLTQGSSDVIVAVIDTGVDYTHPDLRENAWVNEAELNGVPGVDDDGNGYVDDIHGYDFANDDGDPMDDNNHGTHCAGTIAAKGNNGLGVVGVSWNAKIMGVKFLTGSGSGSLANAVKSIDYVTQSPAFFSSNSWGGGPASQAMKEAIQRAGEKGKLFVAAAGNSSSNNDTTPQYPASYDSDNIISVAAIDRRGSLANFSCYGKTTVDIAAPGVDIVSTILGGGTKSYSGTSMATPHVAGAVALVKSLFPNWTGEQIKERILATARPNPRISSHVATGGNLDVYAALTGKVRDSVIPDPNRLESISQNIELLNYQSDYTQTFDIILDNSVKKFYVYFEMIDTEPRYDTITVLDGSSNEIEVLSGKMTGHYTQAVLGNVGKLVFKSDSSVNGKGFRVTKVAVER